MASDTGFGNDLLVRRGTRRDRTQKDQDPFLVSHPACPVAFVVMVAERLNQRACSLPIRRTLLATAKAAITAVGPVTAFGVASSVSQAPEATSR